MFAKIHQAAGNAANGEYNISSSVATLSMHRTPFAIAFFVALIVVNSIQRQSRRAFAHVGQKVCKFKPSFADGNSSSAIIFKTMIQWVVAPLQHLLPNRINRFVRTAVNFGPAFLATVGALAQPSIFYANNISTKAFAHAVIAFAAHGMAQDGQFTVGLANDGGFGILTAAGLGVASDQTGKDYHFFNAAITLTKNLSDRLSVWRNVRRGVTQDYELAESLVNQRRSFLWHNNKCKLLCFRGGSRYCSRDSLLSKYETGGAIYQG